MRKKKTGRLLAAVLLVAFLAVAGVLLWKFYPAIRSLMRPEVMQSFRVKLQSVGILGAAAVFGLQILQVISGIVPALPIQIAAGLTFGALPGLLLCLAGITIGSTFVFVMVKKFGQPVVDRVFSKEKQKKLAFLNDARRLDRIVFILYFIPAMPKDVFTYLAALTPLSLKRYLALTLVARTPTILCSTFASNALMEGDYLQAAVVFCITAVLGILCMMLSPRILRTLEKHAKKK